MNSYFETSTRDDNGSPLTPAFPRQTRCVATRRVEALETIISNLRSALQDAEAELERERERPPAIGDFVRCPLTNFFGRVTKITHRSHGRPWIEITPYLGNDLPGHGTMDLYDSWERIDPPTDDIGAPPSDPLSPKVPRAAGLECRDKPLLAHQPADEIEVLLSKLWPASR